MSIQSRSRNEKRPTVNARREIKAQTLRDKNRVNTLVPYRGEDDRMHTRVESRAAAFNLTPGHRDLGLIPQPRRGGYRLYPQRPAAAGAFGGIRKDARKARDDARRAALITQATKPLFR